MPVLCSVCGVSDFRVSRLREEDIGRLLFLQYPVRCRRCNERSYVHIWHVFKIQRNMRMRHRRTHHM